MTCRAVAAKWKKVECTHIDVVGVITAKHVRNPPGDDDRFSWTMRPTAK